MVEWVGFAPNRVHGFPPVSGAARAPVDPVVMGSQAPVKPQVSGGLAVIRDLGDENGGAAKLIQSGGAPSVVPPTFRRESGLMR